MTEKMELKEKLSKDWISGFKHGIKLVQDIALKQGYEIYVPDIEEMHLEYDDEKRVGNNGNKNSL